MYKVNKLKLYSQWSHLRGHNAEDIVTGLLGLPEPTCPEPGMPFLTHTHIRNTQKHTLHTPYTPTITTLYLGYIELFLMHMSCQSSLLEWRGERRVFFCRSLEPSTEKGTQYMWTEIKDQHPSFKSRTVLRSTIPGHQNVPSFSLYPVQCPQTTLQTHLFLAYHASCCVFFPSS